MSVVPPDHTPPNAKNVLRHIEGPADDERAYTHPNQRQRGCACLPGAGARSSSGTGIYHNGQIVVFQYEREKGGATQADKLASFEGALLVDAESRYNETMRRHPQIRELNCNAHPRRKLRDAEGVQPRVCSRCWPPKQANT